MATITIATPTKSPQLLEDRQCPLTCCEIACTNCAQVSVDCAILINNCSCDYVDGVCYCDSNAGINCPLNAALYC